MQARTLLPAVALAPQPRNRPRGVRAELEQLLKEPRLLAPLEPCKALGCDVAANESGWCDRHEAHWRQP